MTGRKIGLRVVTATTDNNGKSEVSPARRRVCRRESFLRRKALRLGLPQREGYLFAMKTLLHDAEKYLKRGDYWAAAEYMESWLGSELLQRAGLAMYLPFIYRLWGTAFQKQGPGGIAHADGVGHWEAHRNKDFAPFTPSEAAFQLRALWFAVPMEPTAVAANRNKMVGDSHDEIDKAL